MYNLNNEEELSLKKIALQVRKKVIRMIKAGKSGHVGGAMSAADILTALYFNIIVQAYRAWQAKMINMYVS